MMKTRLKKFIQVAVTSQFLVFSFLSNSISVIAADMPNPDDLRNSIIEQATAKTSTVNADTSQATQPVITPATPSSSSNVTNTGDNTNVDNNSNNNTTTEVNNQNISDVNQNVTAEANTGNNQANGNISIGGTGAGIIQTGDATVNVNGVVNAGSNTTEIYGGNGSGGAGSNVTNTGDNVTTSTNGNNNTTTLVNNGNTTTISQSANVKANTGNNVADGNISIGNGPAGAIVTGNASTNVNFLVTAGGNVTLIGGSGNGNGPGDGASIIIANSGPYSQFRTNANSNHYTVVNNNNRAMISQMCGRPIDQREVLVDTASCIANTGGNNVSGNINKNGDAGVIQTGDAILNVTMVADVNHNTTVIDNGSTGGTDATSDVVNTGNNVDVDTNANSNSVTQVNNTNYADVDQTVNARANTGDNIANGNISFGGCAGCIKTGDATVNVNLLTNVNSNDTTIINPNGNGNGNDGAATNVVNTGDDVNIDTNSNNNSNTIINNNNDTTLVQRVWSFVSTGLNEALGNIGGGWSGFIKTGNATSTVNTGAVLNENTTIIDPTITPDPVDPTAVIPTPTNAPEIGGLTNFFSNPASSNPLTPTSGSSSTTGSSSSTGSVLGAATSILPATGPELAVFIIVASLLSLLYGSRLRQYKSNQDSL